MAKRKKSSPPVRRSDFLEARLAMYGLEPGGLPPENAIPAEIIPDAPAACARMLCLLAVSFAAYNFSEADKAMDWLKKEGLWKDASESEKEFFRMPAPTQELQASLSWRFEAAYQLAWALGEVSTPTEPNMECNETHAHDFFSHVPAVGTPAADYCAEASFREEDEVIDEQIFYEKINDYLNDIETNLKENTSGVQAVACRQRLFALRWLVGHENKTNWDQIVIDSDDE